MSVESSNVSPSPLGQSFRRRTLLLAGGGLALAGTAAALARRPRRSDGLPATVNLGSARNLGDGFFIVDGWVLTAEDLEALKSAAPAASP
ncbi:MAG: hypothetical protein ACK4NP_10670 [Parvularculaceae bacterium]